MRESAEFLLSVFDLKPDKPPTHYLMHLALFPHHREGVIFEGDEERFNALISSLTWLRDLPLITHDDKSDLRIYVARVLAAVYERHFKRKASASRPPPHLRGQPPYGPYIRFCDAVGDAFGIEIPAETIATYVGKENTSRNRIKSTSD